MWTVASNEEAAHPTGGHRGEGSRQRFLMRVAKLICSSGEYPCIMRDVSEQGAKLRLFAGHPPDTYMFIELSNGALFPAERRWTKDDLAGFRFTSAVEADDFIDDQHPRGRRPIRLRTNRELPYVAAGDRGYAILVNLSARGACLEAGREMPVGSAVRLEIPGWPKRLASVCWRKDFRHGLAFQEELTLADFARLAHDLQPFAAANAWRDGSALARLRCA